MDRGQQESGNDLAEALDRALVDGPQTISRPSGTVVVVRAEEDRRLTKGVSRLKRLRFDGPSLDGVDLSRDRSAMRDVDLGT